MELETLKQEYARLCAEVDGMPREEIQEELTKAGIDTKEIIENVRRKIEFVKAVHAAKRGMVGGGYAAQCESDYNAALNDYYAEGTRDLRRGEGA